MAEKLKLIDGAELQRQIDAVIAAHVAGTGETKNLTLDCVTATIIHMGKRIERRLAALEAALRLDEARDDQ